MKRFVLAASVVVALGLCSVALAASTLSGTYKTKVHTSALGGGLNGTWTIKFSGMVPGGNQGLYTVTDNGAVVVHGKDTIKGSKLSLKDTGGKDSCLGTGTTVTYKFKLNAGSSSSRRSARRRNPAARGAPSYSQVGRLRRLAE